MTRALRKVRSVITLGVIGGLATAIIGLAWVLFANAIDRRPFVLADIMRSSVAFGSLGGAASFVFAILVTASGGRLGPDGFSRRLGGLFGFAAGAIVACGVGVALGLPMGTIGGLAVLGGGSGTLLGGAFVAVALSGSGEGLQSGAARIGLTGHEPSLERPGLQPGREKPDETREEHDRRTGSSTSEQGDDSRGRRGHDEG
jgi:hypothetical protein